jgi:outer membrane protein assembly factor BamE (lipoprotein component of BamABCDE complex)
MKTTGSLNIFVFVLVMGMTGCASSDSGTVIIVQDPGKLKQLHVNKSTKAQVRKLLGEPQSITMYSNETENWVYQSTHTDYTETYLAKKALSFVPVPYLGSAVGLVDIGPDKIEDTHTLSLIFSKKGILKQIKRETKHK